MENKKNNTGKIIDSILLIVAAAVVFSPSLQGFLPENIKSGINYCGNNGQHNNDFQRFVINTFSRKNNNKLVYNIKICGHEVRSDVEAVSLKHTLSEGEKNSLALSFFLAKIAKKNELEQSIVVFVWSKWKFRFDINSVRLDIIIIKYFSPKFISTGFNHEFGVDRIGNVKFLSDYQDKYAYVYSATPPQSIFGDVISSSEIRKFIKSGVVDMAESMLGRKFSVRGTVIKGRQIGKSLGLILLS